MRVDRETYRRGDVVFWQGETGDRAFFIEHGRIRVVRNDGQHEYNHGWFEGGELLGELAPMDNAPRAATAICETDTEVLAFSRNYLRDALKRADPLLPKMMGTLMQRVRDANPDAAAPGLFDVTQDIDVLSHSQGLRESLAFEYDLERALARDDEFYLAGQAIVGSDQTSIAGYELLLRWQHPERGLIPPGDFIPMAEERGRIGDLGEWVLRRGLRDAAPLVTDADRFLAINLGADQLLSGDITPTVAQICGAARFDPARLRLEITESSLVRDPDVAQKQLKALSRLGCRLAIDDFGTGYSSLSHIHTFPFDTLKIDKSFIMRLDTDEKSRRLVGAILHMAHDLGIDVVAEGVETAKHAEILGEMGCGYYQGFHFHRPEPVADLLDKTAV
jgi:EAL domain-containing protein (putative c-di-GMP-specific phosphodiesterase class I)